MDGVYDRQAPKRVEARSTVDVPTKERERDERERRLDATIAAWNEFDAAYGSFADQYLDGL